MTTTPQRTAIYLTLTSVDLAPMVEELAWTLSGVDSVMYKMDGEEHFQGLQVIGSDDSLEQALRKLLAEQGFSENVQVQETSTIAEEDWAESWKQYWHINRILPHLVIQPSWEPFTPGPDDIVLNLDPGSAFGTGTHETTQLMLLLLYEQHLQLSKKPIRLLDVGTGSGILAIYGAKLGMTDIVATDNDPHAVEVARENCDRNQVGDKIRCTTQSLPELADGPFDVVLANILAPVIRDMMADLVQVTAPGGTLMLSGINRHQYEMMAESIRLHDLSLKRILRKGDWIALVCHRPR